MTAPQRKKFEHERAPTHESAVPKVFEDRIAADGEQVAHILDPNRTTDNVRFPDPSAPYNAGDDSATTAQSNADIQMARRTDAGPNLATNRAAPESRSTMLLWFAGAAGLLLVMAVLIALL